MDAKFTVAVKLSIDTTVAEVSGGCLRRALQVLGEGRSPGNLVLLYLRPPTAGCARAIGALCFSTGRRFLFFPGFDAKGFMGYRGSALAPDMSREGFHLHHVTLDRHFTRWHFTGRSSDQASDARIAFGRTTQAAPGVRSWFSLAVQSEQGLDQLAQRVLVDLPCPVTDVGRRAQLARECIALMMEAPVAPAGDGHWSEDEYLQLDFFIATQGSQIAPESPEWSRSLCGPPFKPDRSPHGQVPIRVCRLSGPSGLPDIIINISLRPGHLLHSHYIVGQRLPTKAP